MGFQLGVVRGVYGCATDIAEGGGFPTSPVEALELTWDGIPGDRHGGRLRRADARQPWLPRGLEMRNDRQVSALSVDDLAAIAATLSMPETSPMLLGANLLIDGLPDFSRIGTGAHLCFGGDWRGEGTFDGGAILKIEAYNHPCRGPGRKLAAAHGRPELEFAFVKAARSLRGLVLSVSRPGVVRAGDPVVMTPPAVAP
jgi:hypothetical protein